MTSKGMRLEDYVRELTERHTHREHYQVRVGHEWRGRNHQTAVPPLIAQLWANDIPSAVQGDAADDAGRPTFASKPAARLDALDTAARIDLYAEQWIHKLGVTPRSSSTIVMVQQLHGLTPSQLPLIRREVEHDIRRWWIWARVVTGWDAPAWKPAATCPQCAELGSIRIKLAEHHATCVNDACRATWDETTIGLLADHIRSEVEAERQPRQGPGPCWCPWPEPSVSDLDWLCPRCGSARCHNALGRRLVDTLVSQRGA